MSKETPIEKFERRKREQEALRQKKELKNSQKTKSEGDNSIKEIVSKETDEDLTQQPKKDLEKTIPDLPLKKEKNVEKNRESNKERKQRIRERDERISNMSATDFFVHVVDKVNRKKPLSRHEIELWKKRDPESNILKTHLEKIGKTIEHIQESQKQVKENLEKTTNPQDQENLKKSQAGFENVAENLQSKEKFVMNDPQTLEELALYAEQDAITPTSQDIEDQSDQIPEQAPERVVSDNEQKAEESFKKMKQAKGTPEEKAAYHQWNLDRIAVLRDELGEKEEQLNQLSDQSKKADMKESVERTRAALEKIHVLQTEHEAQVEHKRIINKAGETYNERKKLENDAERAFATKRLGFVKNRVELYKAEIDELSKEPNFLKKVMRNHLHEPNQNKLYKKSLDLEWGKLEKLTPEEQAQAQALFDAEEAKWKTKNIRFLPANREHFLSELIKEKTRPLRIAKEKLAIVERRNTRIEKQLSEYEHINESRLSRLSEKFKRNWHTTSEWIKKPENRKKMFSRMAFSAGVATVLGGATLPAWALRFVGSHIGGESVRSLYDEKIPDYRKMMFNNRRKYEVQAKKLAQQQEGFATMTPQEQSDLIKKHTHELFEKKASGIIRRKNIGRIITDRIGRLLGGGATAGLESLAQKFSEIEIPDFNFMTPTEATEPALEVHDPQPLDIETQQQVPVEKEVSASKSAPVKTSSIESGKALVAKDLPAHESFAIEDLTENKAPVSRDPFASGAPLEHSGTRMDASGPISKTYHVMADADVKEFVHEHFRYENGKPLNLHDFYRLRGIEYKNGEFVNRFTKIPYQNQPAILRDTDLDAFAKNNRLIYTRLPGDAPDSILDLPSGAVPMEHLPQSQVSSDSIMIENLPDDIQGLPMESLPKKP